MKIKELDLELSQLLNEIIDNETSINERIRNVHPDYKLSAKNLIRYLILRSKDLRKYHKKLSDYGLSSLRTAEGYVYNNLLNVVRNLKMINNVPFQINPEIEKVGYSGSIDIIKKHSINLFDKSRYDHFTKIMVTLPDEAAIDKSVIREMADNGMEIARINLSHGTEDQWKSMIENIRAVEMESGINIKIYMDLSGPKIRTGKFQIKNENGEISKKIRVNTGDKIILCKQSFEGNTTQLPGKDAKNCKMVSVSIDEVIEDAKIGDTLYFDDGMIKSKVIDKNENELMLELLHCFKAKLGSSKGINLPFTRLNIPALTEKDRSDLVFITKHADILGYSFVRNSRDVEELYSALEAHKADNIGVVFKIENNEAFENFPEILLKGMERDKIGVMIARGDLAVEIGFERISEVQNEILWLCEAAHIPVIWATQVLENLAKTGIPTRAEVSDAAMAVQAECVMLNKGPYIVKAIQVLKNILARMEEHSFKKKDELRALNVAKSYMKHFNQKKKIS